MAPPERGKSASGAPLFAEEVAAIEYAMTAIGNAQFTPEPNDPRNLDPDDEPLAEMLMASGTLADAVDALRNAVRAEMSRRDALLDDMTEEQYEAWEKAVA